MMAVFSAIGPSSAAPAPDHVVPAEHAGLDKLASPEPHDQGHNTRMRKIDALDGLLGLVDDGLERKDRWPEVREDQVPVGRRQ